MRWIYVQYNNERAEREELRLFVSKLISKKIMVVVVDKTMALLREPFFYEASLVEKSSLSLSLLFA